MLAFLGRRFLIAIPTIILISIFVFGMQKLLSGDPVLAMAGEERDPEVLEFLREKYRLNDPIVVQYFHWIGNALRGDLGISLRTNQPVTELIAEKLPVTIQLAVMALIIALMGFFGGLVMSAIKRDRGVKDWGDVITGHGGFIDRLDSVIFAAPIFFHLTRYWWHV